MTTFLTIVVVILAFSFLVFIHELGHFLMAKKAGIKVHEFAIGFPPRLWQKKKGETVYSINAIPFGGYVKLYGEDASDPKILRSKRSFASKSLRARIGVVIGGVIMNFIAAFLLFTIGFTIGMKPLLPDISLINSGIIETTPGIIIKTVDDNSTNLQKFETGDNLISINDQPTSKIKDLPNKIAGKDENFQIKTAEIIRNNKKIQLKEPPTQAVELYEFTSFPHLEIQSVQLGSESQRAGLQRGDIIIAMNNASIFSFEDYQNAFLNNPKVTYSILRDWQPTEITVNLPTKHQVIIEEVIQDSPAEKIGLQKNDIIFKINDEDIYSPAEALKAIQQNPNELKLTVNRNSINKVVTISPDENGLLGVRLQKLNSHTNQQLTVFTSFIPTSVTKINDLQYPVHIAAIESLKTMKDLSYLTASSFLGALKSIASKFTVPQEVGGAVAITTMIHQKVQTGPMDVIQIIAYLSLVLAVINILPLPALDGGRLFFLLVEGITGRRTHPKWEAHIHGIGFLLFLLLIIVVTYNDILRLL